MKKSALVIAARSISGLSGYLVLAIAANHLTAAQFAALSLLQTIIFLSQIVFDSGLTQLATRENAGSPDWRLQASAYQNSRLTVHAGLAALLMVFHAAGLIPTPTQGSWLPLVAALALLSNAFVLDWLLFARQEQRLWAIKVLITAGSNVLITAGLLIVFSRPEAVLAGVALANLAGWIYLHTQGMTWQVRLAHPSRQTSKHALQLSLGAMLFHAAYNAPLLMATAMHASTSGAAFAILYRLFSAMTLFVPTLMEFAVAREVAALKKGESHGQLKVLFRLLTISLLVCSPVIVMPSHHLHATFALAIDLGKYQINPEDFNYIKVALLLFSVDYCSQRTAFVFDRRKLIIGSAVGGLLAAGAVLALTVNDLKAIEPVAWFHPLFTYQVTSALLILANMTSLHRREIKQ
jgi:O-antigen/teichoic acid export membrane protein